MAKKSDFVNLGDKLDKLLEFMKEDAKKSTEGEAAKSKKEESKKTSRGLKKVGKGLLETAGSMVGLTASMFTLKGVMGDLKGMNSDVSKSLTQVNLATQGSAKTIARFNDSATGLKQQIGAFADATSVGMTNFSNSTLKFSTQLKAQGTDSKTTMGLIRSNTQGLGMSQESSLALADSLVSTAAKNGDSIDGLITAIAGMKEAMISTTVALGPKAAESAQKVAAMMSQTNSELTEASTKFVSSFLSGAEGYAKAAKFGVQITGNESDVEMAAKFQQLIDRVAQLTEGMKGAGSQNALAAVSKDFNLSMEDINLAQQIGTFSTELTKGNTDQRQRDLSKISLDQSYQNATRNTQAKGLEAVEGAASAVNSLGKMMNGYMIGLIAVAGLILGVVTSILVSMRMKSLTDMFRGKGKGLGKFKNPFSTKSFMRGPTAAAAPSRLAQFAKSPVSTIGNSLAKSSSPWIKSIGNMTTASAKWSSGVLKSVTSFSKGILTATKSFGGGILKSAGGLLKGAGGLLKGASKPLGLLAKGAGKLLGPITAVVTGVSKGIETGSWVEGLKRGVTSAVIYGAGAALAPMTGGASLVAAAALDMALGDSISDAIPGGSGAKSPEIKKQTTKNLAKQTSASMLELGLNKDAGFTEEQLDRIASNTLKNLEFNEEVKNMTRETLEMKKSELEENRAGPMTQLSNYLANNIMAMDRILVATEIGNEQRADQTGVIEAGSSTDLGLGPITAGGFR
jgi:hypothetical protein